MLGVDPPLHEISEAKGGGALKYKGFTAVCSKHTEHMLGIKKAPPLSMREHSLNGLMCMIS